jgi:hypothetical protein
VYPALCRRRRRVCASVVPLLLPIWPNAQNR